MPHFERLLAGVFQADIIGFPSYAAALAAGRRATPDAFVIDAGGTDAPGVALARQLRTLQTYKFVPIIGLTTGAFASTDVAELFLAGFDEVLQKPFESGLLVTALTRALKIKVDPDLLLVHTGLETQGFDYKERLDFSTADGRASLAKDVIAMANWGGGIIVVGFAERERGAFEPCGVPPEDIATYETTRVNRAIRDFLDPPLSVSLRRVKDERREYVVLEVPASRSTIVLAARENPVARLYKGRIYTRTTAVESAEAQTSADIRRIIERLLSQH